LEYLLNKRNKFIKGVLIMSCVIGLLNEGKLYMASDGLATTEDGERRPVICIKLFKNKNYLIGYTGSVRHGQVLGPKFFEPPTNIYDFPDAAREKFIESGCILTTENNQQVHGSNILIGFNGRLFEVLIDFQINEVSGDFTSIGSGSQYAMGSLFATKKWKSPEKRIINALDCAKEYVGSCGKPYTIEVME
jgi:ATP-dependent protease HslVU (ClpYQ) peptidase subunit